MRTIYRSFRKMLCFTLSLHSWKYFFSTRFDTTYRVCKCCSKQQTTSWNDFRDVRWSEVLNPAELKAIDNNKHSI